MMTADTEATTFSALATRKSKYEQELARHDTHATLSVKSWAALTSGMADSRWDCR